MSKHFELFDHDVRHVPPLRSSLNGSGNVGPSPSILGLSVAWRAQLEKLVNRVYLLPGAPVPHMLVFLGAEQESGCESVCAGTGELLASHISGSVCVFEANPKAISLQKQLGLRSGKGFPDLLVDADLSLKSVALQVSGGGLWLLPGGFPLSDGVSPEDSDRFLNRMNELRTNFDFVLIDAPPSSISWDGFMLAQVADAAVLVVSTSSAHRQSCVRLKQALEATGVMLVGAVVIDKPLSGCSTRNTG